MIHEVLPVGPLQCNCSIWGDEETREAVVVDPGDDIRRIRAILSRHGLAVKWIVITHAHADHIGGANRLRSLTGAPVYMHPADHQLLPHLALQAAWLGMRDPGAVDIDTALAEGDTLGPAGASLTVLHTPGHTLGSVSLLCSEERKLLAGDTLFRGSIGRTDLPGGDYRKILGSIKTKLLCLDDDIAVTCGHGLPTTVGREREQNYFLRNL